MSHFSLIMVWDEIQRRHFKLCDLVLSMTDNRDVMKLVQRYGMFRRLKESKKEKEEGKIQMATEKCAFFLDTCTMDFSLFILPV